MSSSTSQHESSRHDVKLEQALGNLLRAGVLTAAAFVVAGAILLLLRTGGAPVRDYHHFVPPRAQLRSVPGIFFGALTLDPRSLIQFGMLVLIATPVLRVAASLVGFLIEHDRLYVVITAIVLAILIFSMAGGRGI